MTEKELNVKTTINDTIVVCDNNKTDFIIDSKVAKIISDYINLVGLVDFVTKNDNIAIKS